MRIRLGLFAFVGVFALAVVMMFGQFVLAATTAAIMPSADGFYAQWTPSTGTSHFALVDETPCNTTDYNSTIVVGNRDSYTVDVSSVPNGATITQIDIKPCASRVKVSGANPVMNVFYRLNGVNSADAGAYSLSGTSPVEQATTTYSSLSVLKTATTTLEAGAVLTSSTKGAKLSRIATTITYTALTAPSGASDSATTTSQIRVLWSDNSSNEAGFTVDRSLDALNWTTVATTSANVNSYYDTGLSTYTRYYHRVRAYNFGAYSAYSNTASATTTDTIPAAPSGLIATAVPSGTSTNVVLDWTDNSSNELGFKVERNVGTSTTIFSQIATTTANIITYTDLARPSGTYVYRIRAYNSGGNSVYSNTATTTIP